MNITKIIEKIVGYYQKHRIKLIIGLILVIIISISLQLYVFLNESIMQDDMHFDYMGWTQTCNNKVYNPEDMLAFCNTCFEQGGAKCNWPLDMNITVAKVERTLRTGGEVHCFNIIDGVNYYTEKGSYYGLTNSSLFTWQVIDSTKPHTVEFCCGIQRENPIATFIGIEKKWPQACIKQDIEPRCIPKTV